MNEVLKLRPNKNSRESSARGTKSVVEFLTSLYRNVKYTWLEWHEALHAVVAMATGAGALEASNVAEGNSGGHVLMKKKNLVAFAASHNMPGNSFDRAYVEAHGENFDALGGIADGIVAQNIELARAIARAMVVERTLNESRLGQIEDEVKNGGKVKIKVTTRDGREHTFEFRARDGEDITIEVPLVEDEPQNNPAGSSKRKYIPSILLPRFEEEPMTEETFTRDFRKAA